MNESTGNERPRFSTTTSILLALATFVVGVVFYWTVIGFFAALLSSLFFRVTLMHWGVILVIAIAAIGVGFHSARAAFRYSRSPRETNPALRLSNIDWIAAIASGMLLCFILLALFLYPVIPQKGIKALSISVLLDHATIPLFFGVWNVITVLRIKRRKRIAAERKRLAAIGKCNHCGYDLRGNKSGLCPECGVEI